MDDKDVQRNLWFVVLCTMIMLLIVIFFSIRFIKKYLPKIPEDFFIFSSDDVVERLVLTPQMKPPKLQVSPRWGKKHSILLPLEEGLKEDIRTTPHIRFQPNIIESLMNIDGTSPFKEIPDKGYRMKHNRGRPTFERSSAFERSPPPRRQYVNEDLKFKITSSSKLADKSLKVTFYTENETTKL